MRGRQGLGVARTSQCQAARTREKTRVVVHSAVRAALASSGARVCFRLRSASCSRRCRADIERLQTIANPPGHVANPERKKGGDRKVVRSPEGSACYSFASFGARRARAGHLPILGSADTFRAHKEAREEDPRVSHVASRPREVKRARGNFYSHFAQIFRRAESSARTK